MSMKKVLTACLAMVFVLTVALSAFAQRPDRDVIKKRVDEIVAAINSGKTAADFKSTEKEYPPYMYFIMKMDGTMLVHRGFAGRNIKGDCEQMYKAVSKADTNGIWVTYEAFPGAGYYAYVKKTKDELIVGCSY
jgi:ABC-type transporter MlaC component